MDFKENFLFEKYKDCNLKSSGEFRNKLRKSNFKDYEDVDIGELYRRIVNYQIKKYGNSLSSFGPGYIPLRTLIGRCSSRKSAKRRQLGINGDKKKERWTEK